MNVKPGDYIVLKGYPYEGIDATVLDVNYTVITLTMTQILLLLKR